MLRLFLKIYPLIFSCIYFYSYVCRRFINYINLEIIPWQLEQPNTLSQNLTGWYSTTFDRWTDLLSYYTFVCVPLYVLSVLCFWTVKLLLLILMFKHFGIFLVLWLPCCVLYVVWECEVLTGKKLQGEHNQIYLHKNKKYNSIIHL